LFNAVGGLFSEGPGGREMEANRANQEPHEANQEAYDAKQEAYDAKQEAHCDK